MSTTRVSLDQAIDAAMQLPPEQRDMLLAILQKRQVEAQRQEIADDAQDSIAMYRAGKLKPQSAEEIVQELRKAARDLE